MELGLSYRRSAGGGGGEVIPDNAILDENGDPLRDENGNIITDET